MKILLMMAVGAILGYPAGVVLGLAVECSWKTNPSNLCGLVALVMYGPIGLVIGLGLGYSLSRTRVP